MLNKGLFTSLRGDWKTPKQLYAELNKEFNFDCDPCPSNFLPDDDPDEKWDGFKEDWGKINFVNPPYGRVIGAWIKKGFDEWKKGKTVVFLIPSRTDTRWWHDYIMKADEIRFIKGRLHFDDNKNPAPFPSAVVVFKSKSIQGTLGG